MPYPRYNVSLPDNSDWIFGTYKPNVSINPWDTPFCYHIWCFLPKLISKFFFRCLFDSWFPNHIHLYNSVNSLYILSNHYLLIFISEISTFNWIVRYIVILGTIKLCANECVMLNAKTIYESKFSCICTKVYIKIDKKCLETSLFFFFFFYLWL